MRTVKHDGHQWRVQWIPKGQLSEGKEGLEREITISCSPSNGPVQYVEITTDEIADSNAFMSLDDDEVRDLIRRSR